MDMKVHVNANDIKKDADGFEDIDAFWESAEPVEQGDKNEDRKSKSNRRTSAVSTLEEDYSTSDDISDDDGDDSTRFSYDTTGTIQDMSSFNTTTNTTSHLSVNENPDYDTDEGEASMVASKSALSTASSSKKKQGTSVLKKSASKSTNNSRRNSAASESAGSRRVSFGSPIMADNQFSPNNDTFDNNTPFTGESSASSRRSSGSRKHDNSEVSTNSVPDVSTPNSSGTEFEMSMLSTGGSTGTRRGASIISTPGSTEFARGRRVSDATFINESESEGDSDEGADTTGLDESGFTVNDSLVASAIKRKKGNYNEDSSSESENEGRTRRSSRRTKGVTHAWWKNERVVYDRGNMIGFLEAEKTPQKRKFKSSKTASNKVRKHVDKEEEAPIHLPKGLKYIKREKLDTLKVYDDSSDGMTYMPVVCLHENLKPSALPVTDLRPPNMEHLVGLAAQTFNVGEVSNFSSAWISGFVDLQPGCFKDPETVGDCAQVFFVSECQDGALEFAMADPENENWVEEKAQRVLLSKKDSFYVPPGNMYRLENHSTTKPCFIFWTIIKALSQNRASPNVSK